MRHYTNVVPYTPKISPTLLIPLGFVVPDDKDGLVVECAWDKHLRAQFGDRFAAAHTVDEEVNGVDGYEMTRRLLTTGQNYHLPAGVNHADVFVAYDSRASAARDVPLLPLNVPTDAVNQAPAFEKLGVLIAHNIGIPDIKDPETALKEVIALAGDHEFRRKRSDLYEFQMTCLSRGIAPEAIAAELRDRNAELHRYLERQAFPIKKKAGFMLASTLLAAAGGFANPILGGLGALLGVWRFATFDRKPSGQLPHRLEPVAAFHDIKEKVGIEFR